MKNKKIGINWIWYFADTKEEVIEYLEELTNRTHTPEYDWMIIQEPDGRWSFRLHK